MTATMTATEMVTGKRRVASLVYAHGFISSPQSAKALQLQQWMEAHFPDIPLRIPVLPPFPLQAMAVLESELENLPQPVGLIGSSMGGYYSAWLAQRHGGPAVLVNPLVRPRGHESRYVGDHHNPATGECFRIEPHHTEELLGFAVNRFTHPGRVLLLLQTGDETLDYRMATRAWPDCPRVVIPGGHHAFENFDHWLPFVLRFFGFPMAATGE